MMIQKKKSPVVNKKVTVKKPEQRIKQIPVSTEDTDEKSTELQNLMELINIEKIVRDIVQKELARLGVINLPVQQSSSNIDPDEREYIDDPMEVDLIRVKEAKDLTTVEGWIENSSISVVVDSASNKDIMPKFVADEFGLKIDTSVTHNIRGATGEKKSLGTVSTFVFLAPGCNIKTNFTVVDDYPIRELILSRNTLMRHNYDLHESRKHMAITCNGKNFFIPIVPDRNRQVKKKSEVSPVIQALTA